MNMKYRCHWQDYNGTGTYLITIVTSQRKPLLGKLAGDETIPLGTEGAPSVILSPLGNTILFSEIKKVTTIFPEADVWKTCIMPDHIHFIIRIKQRLKPGKNLGHIISGFKYGCTVTARKMGAIANNEPLFEPGYNDRILYQPNQITHWHQYLADNARRLLIKRKNPNFFTVMRDLSLHGYNCQTIGNSFLLDIPNKVAVIVHRRYSATEIAQLKHEWLKCGECGGVLVSAAISPKEKEIIKEAFDLGYRIILLRENGFPPLYKPTGKNFDYCNQGLLLQISPWEHHASNQKISREQCLALNALAEAIASTGQ